MSSYDDRRKLKRKFMLFKIPVYDAATRRFLGLVQDITEGGIQLFGVQIEVGTTKNIVLQATDYVRSSPLFFEAICRWSRRENPQGYYISGLEITRIGEDVKGELVKLMEYVTLG